MNFIAKRILAGQDLRKAIQELVSDNSISAGFVASAVGSLSDVRIRLAGAQEYYSEVGEFEIVCLQGTVSIHGCHLHLAAADASGQVVGGHLEEGCVIRTTCELVIVSSTTTEFRRLPDHDTGFKELRVEDLPGA